MKAFRSLLVALLALIQIVSASFKFELVYSDETVNVGDIDLFMAVWVVFYNTSDQHGALSNKNYETFSKPCQMVVTSQTDLSVDVSLDAQYGVVGEVTGWQMRSALVEAMWAAVIELGKLDQYTIYLDCYIGQQFESPPLCGVFTDPQCPCMQGPTSFPFCYKSTTGHKVPAVIRLQTYESDGTLLPDNYEINFASYDINPVSGGCGKGGALAEVLASFIPVIGTFIEKGIKVACRE